ncbi:contact-dependent growth inhibition system immunity protein [Psychrobacter sp. JCM 18902]|jgi:hypothetical protein|uniref:contact-dependent growth inhibition system immunity protein n=1 Tax=Psychrobacter sp. JCM 18902 TaxID=1298607 RepID=UPI0019197864|nr:contact-dependent growth inhibition system immunity protein [Psychrobacter sp. JCM 18902]
MQLDSYWRLKPNAFQSKNATAYTHECYVLGNIVINTFIYLMNAYLYQNWWAEYSDPKVNDADVLIHFASKENLDILNSLVQDLEYILANDLAKKVFENNTFDFDPLLNGYASEQAWIESAYKTLMAEIR